MKRYIRSTAIDESLYNESQLFTLRHAIEDGLDISWLADPNYSHFEMDEIYTGLREGLDVSTYADPKYGFDQMKQIREGLEAGVDISIYADPKFTGIQMKQIREGLEAGVDVSWYADPAYSDGQMEAIREGLEAGLDVSIYADPKYNWKLMNKILKCLETGSGDLNALLNKKKPSKFDNFDAFYQACWDELLQTRHEDHPNLEVDQSTQGGHGSTVLYDDGFDYPEYYTIDEADAIRNVKRLFNAGSRDVDAGVDAIYEAGEWNI